MSIKIILADDHKIIFECLKPLLDKEPGLEVVAEANNGREAVKRAQELEPDIVIMDISMPDLNGVEATRQIISRCPGIKVIALSMNIDRKCVTDMLRAGASGYLTKNCSFKEVVSAVQSVAAGKTFLSSEVSGIVIDESLGQAPITGSSLSSTLTMREREVLQLLAEGKTVKEIAEILFISIKTVHVHRTHIMEKLNIQSMYELIKYAIREGLTPLND